MPKLILYVKPKFEEYDIGLYIYDDHGKLVEEKTYSSVKQVVIKAGEVRLSKQLFHEYISLIVDAKSLTVEVKENGLLYIHG
ncbi:MAG: hypothetical protein QXW94_01300 [Desulfurococcaceae archaeon]